jgi:hypothetical protein
VTANDHYPQGVCATLHAFQDFCTMQRTLMQLKSVKSKIPILAFQRRVQILSVREDSACLENNLLYHANTSRSDIVSA